MSVQSVAVFSQLRHLQDCFSRKRLKQKNEAKTGMAQRGKIGYGDSIQTNSAPAI
jgi:hypothetical protein